jgi:hypothetical protein
MRSAIGRAGSPNVCTVPRVEPLPDGMPRVAREAYFWQRGDEPTGWGE